MISTQKSDSHKKSLSEAFVNSFGSYPIGYALGIVILPCLNDFINFIENDNIKGIKEEISKILVPN